MTVVMYRLQQRGRRGQIIVTSQSQEVKSCLLDLAHSFFLCNWFEPRSIISLYSVIVRVRP